MVKKKPDLELSTEEFEEQVYSRLTPDGRKELPDPVPTEPPLGYSNGPSLADFVQRMIHTEISRRAAEEEFETFEEADDFDVEDDPLDPLTPYEEVFMPKPPPITPKGEAQAEGGSGGGGARAIDAPPPPVNPATTTSNEKL